MTDIVSRQRRSEIMGAIRNSDTAPERQVRSWLHARGYRFRKNVRTLPGAPDIVLPRWKAVIFVHGCFWHRHRACKLAYTPKSRTDWWLAKFSHNTARDSLVRSQLEQVGWKVVTVWECEVRNREFEQWLESALQDKPSSTR